MRKRRVEITLRVDVRADTDAAYDAAIRELTDGAMPFVGYHSSSGFHLTSLTVRRKDIREVWRGTP